MKIELELKIKDKEEDFEVEHMIQNTQKQLAEVEQHKVLFSEESSNLYSSTRPEAKYEFDYEVNNVRFGEEKEQEYLYIKKKINYYQKIDPITELFDTLNIPYNGDQQF